MDRTALAKKNILIGLFNKFILLILPFIVRTVLLYYLGLEYVGLNSLFTSIFTMLNLSELGVGSAIVYQMYKPYAENNVNQTNKLLNFYKKIYRLIGLVIGIIGLCLIPFLRFLINDTLPLDVNLYFLYVVYLFNVCSSYWLFAYKVAILNVSQNTRIKNGIDLIAFATQYLLQIIIIILFKNYNYYISVIPVFTIIDNLLVAFITKRRFPQLFASGEISKADRSKIQNNVFSLVGHKIGATIITSTDNIVISAFLGLTILGVYNNYYYVMYTVITILSIIYFALLPTVGNTIVTKSKEYNLALFYNLSFANTWIIGWFAVCLICLYQDFITLWTGAENVFPFDIVILFVLDFYLWKIYDNVALFKDAAGIWREDILRPYIASGVNLLINIILVNLIGIRGVLISTILSIALINIPWSAVVLFNSFFKNKCYKYFVKQFFYLVCSVAACVVTYLLCGLIDGISIIHFVYKMAICVVVPNIIFFLFYFRKREFKYMYNTLVSKIVKRS